MESQEKSQQTQQAVFLCLFIEETSFEMWVKKCILLLYINCSIWLIVMYILYPTWKSILYYSNDLQCSINIQFSHLENSVHFNSTSQTMMTGKTFIYYFT